jgi:hypothetical protein
MCVGFLALRIRRDLARERSAIVSPITVFDAATRQFFCLTAPQAFFRPDRRTLRPPRTAAVNDGPSFGGRPQGLSLTAVSTVAGLVVAGL